MNRICINCKQSKDIEEFELENTRAGNTTRRTTCKKCRNLYRVSKKRFKEHGITVEEYENLLKTQNYLCAICQTNLKQIDTRDVHLDHCHETGTVRGILCSHCNLGIGHFGDDVSRLQSAIDYLNGFKIPSGSLTLTLD